MSHENSPATGGRRKLLLAGAGLAAGATGLGLAWRRHLAENPSLSPAEQSFWAARFERPVADAASGSKDLLMADFRGKPLLLNFWATWCPPCVKELPELAQFHREFQKEGWQVLGLALDAATPVREFQQKLALDFPQGLAGLAGTELSRSLGNSQGGLPFSVAFAANGRVMWRKLGATTLEELRPLGRGKLA
ncbi:thiol-disulfide isomerase/thioredoxin [Paucibacter oligotrophus]|uniref:Thiol-disulfide isomerase/thioredoxin n=1 Tax=Roseateles oligotrophus TaxID=1769250 RepID=A0A840LF74_9BURK|nr:TlpA disulfide reductase family protein [Roseateles oligotrophus]MBB4845293.1 thiol-disulfide isomerase/thioredoxin [Roseateles oligotrophus]